MTTTSNGDLLRGIELSRMAEDCGFVLLPDGRLAGSMYSLRTLAQAIEVRVRREESARGGKHGQ
ncbi:hypothetical protein [Cupriavidus sp. AcVe19-6a]|uniref:hypothetical protein n=1 Tax=Cupriavidus sp. AcVe19-6a TaxID=2821358 RepID=UPI001AE2C85A|nr:hypothetical protein [Cupriavidus sp. AcVe19-6a]MBP0634878.1 hypothetical protein [Cupriavidus sp. AcVe19-6a]